MAMMFLMALVGLCCVGKSMVLKSLFFANIPTFDNVSDLNNANGFTITGLGQIDAAGGVQGGTTSDPVSFPINYFYITSTSNATTGNVKGGGQNNSAGPVTLEVVNG